jgi:hypothetical protein
MEDREEIRRKRGTQQLHDVPGVSDFPVLLLMMAFFGLVGGFATSRIRRIWAQARNRQAVADDEQLREVYRKKQVVVNVPERSEEMALLKQKVDKLEENNEALLTVLKETLQKDDEPQPKKRSIGFIDTQDKSARK